MQIGVIGLGRMGSNIVRCLLGAGHGRVVLDKQPVQGRKLAGKGALVGLRKAEQSDKG